MNESLSSDHCGFWHHNSTLTTCEPGTQYSKFVLVLCQLLVRVFDFEEPYDTTWECGIMRTLLGGLSLLLSLTSNITMIYVFVLPMAYLHGVPQDSCVTQYAVTFNGIRNVIGPAISTSLLHSHYHHHHLQLLEQCTIKCWIQVTTNCHTIFKRLLCSWDTVCTLPTI